MIASVCIHSLTIQTSGWRGVGYGSREELTSLIFGCLALKRKEAWYNEGRVLSFQSCEGSTGPEGVAEIIK